MGYSVGLVRAAEAFDGGEPGEGAAEAGHRLVNNGVIVGARHPAVGRVRVDPLHQQGAASRAYFLGFARGNCRTAIDAPNGARACLAPTRRW